MKKCIKCGSHAFNLYAEEIDQGGLCDVHYWQGRAHRAEALAQPEQEPVAVIDVHEFYDNCANFSLLQKLPKGKHTLYTAPPQRTWVGLTDEEIADCAEKMEASDPTDSFWREFFRGIEAKLKEKNT